MHRSECCEDLPFSECSFCITCKLYALPFVFAWLKMPHSLSCEPRWGEKPHMECQGLKLLPFTALAPPNITRISSASLGKTSDVWLASWYFRAGFSSFPVAWQLVCNTWNRVNTFIFEIGSRHLEADLECASVPYGIMREDFFLMFLWPSC